MVIFKQRSRSLFFIALLAGAVNGLPGAAEAAEEAATDTSASQPFISTSGSGEVSVDPDGFRISIGVEVQDKSLQKAQNQVNAAMERILQTLKNLEIPGLSLRTEILQIYPVYTEDATPAVSTGERKLIGYRARNEVSVAVLKGIPAELGERASRIIHAAVQRGANRVGNVNFFLQDPAAAQDRALKAAVDDATRKAQAIASAAGVRIVKLRRVEEGFGPLGLPMQSAPSTAGGMGESTPVETGQLVVVSNITARFVFAK
ncbi:hypothetical protein BE08_43980 [Sorangium cellulosum]|uniref:Outer membrane protein n=1 Tax=Sorangium cellulosum TaxID=56 RepID=A0A150PQ75_SORCE|nr:hypothetical protein BE08_43980 [Sorangium cellulosum]